MSMFDNYPQSSEYIPDNRPKCCKHFKLDIMTGETAIHTFEIPFNVEESCLNVEVIYKKGLTPVIIKSSEQLDISTLDGHSIITCYLSAEDTSLFEHTYLNTRVQIKFYMTDGDITYSEVYPVTVMNSLDVDDGRPIPPAPGTLGGLGYTED